MQRYLLLLFPLFLCATEIQLGSFTRNEQLQWSIASSDYQPNILSELTWENVRFQGLSLKLVHYFQGWHVSFSGAEATALYGDVRDSDYLGSNRTNESFRSLSSAKGSRFKEYLAEIAYPLPAGSHSIIPFLQVSKTDEELYLRDGWLSIPYAQAIANLDSRYNPSYYGLKAGLRGQLELFRDTRLMVSVSRSFINYEATATWNLRTDLAQPTSFEHDSSGNGWQAEVAAITLPFKAIEISLRGVWEEFEITGGNHLTYYADGTQTTQPIHEITSETQTLFFEVSYRF